MKAQVAINAADGPTDAAAIIPTPTLHMAIVAAVEPTVEPAVAAALLKSVASRPLLGRVARVC